MHKYSVLSKVKFTWLASGQEWPGSPEATTILYVNYSGIKIKKCVCVCVCKEWLANSEKHENTTHNEKKTIEIGLVITQKIELVGKDIKT